MRILIPMDGSDCSQRALEYAVQLGEMYSGTLDVIHFTDVRTDATDELLNAIDELLGETHVECHVEVRTDIRLSEPRSSTHIGRRILELVDEKGYDHVIMGHHGTGAVGELVLGSAAKTVLKAGAVPVTVVP